MLEKKTNYYPSLNGLRAISIIIVLLSHIGYNYSLFPRSFRFLPLLLDGQFGVNVFFVISGFLITSLLLNEEGKTSSISLKKFFIRRTLRIFPAYYFLLLVYFILHLSNVIFIPSDAWITALTYTKYFNWNIEWYTSHGWTLSVEEHFYLIWPFIFIIGILFRKIAAIFIILLVPMLKLYFHFHTVSWINELTIFYRIDAIAVGCLCALYKDNIINVLNNHWKLIFSGSILLLACLHFDAMANRNLNLGLDLLIISIGGTYGSIANLSIAVIMFYSIFGPKEIWFNFLNLKLVSYIGILSYSLYLWQQFFLAKTDYWVNGLPQNLILIIITALGSYYLIEKPFFKLKDKFAV